MIIVKWAAILGFWVALAALVGFVFLQFVMIAGGGNAIP